MALKQDHDEGPFSLRPRVAHCAVTVSTFKTEPLLKVR